MCENITVTKVLGLVVGFTVSQKQEGKVEKSTFFLVTFDSGFILMPVPVLIVLIFVV